MNFSRFTEQLESFLALEQRGRWSAVGLVDITGFKWYNDALGHAVGDRIIERVAQLLREQVRSDDIIAQERGDPPAGPPCAFRGRRILLPHSGYRAVLAGACDRRALPRSGGTLDWSLEDQRLVDQPVRVDVGVVCLWLGPVSGRRFAARRLAADLIQRADMLMYEAKGERASHIYLLRAELKDGQLVDRTSDAERASDEPAQEWIRIDPSRDATSESISHTDRDSSPSDPVVMCGSP